MTAAGVGIERKVPAKKSLLSFRLETVLET